MAIAEILLGRDAGWQVQRRDESEVPAKELMRRYAWPTFFGAAMAASAYAVSLPLLLWMTPVLIGLLLCVPIAMLSSRISDPASTLFRIPEETAPPRVLVRAEEFAKTTGEAAMSPLLELLDDRQLLASHLANLPDGGRRDRGQVDPHLAIARAKIEEAETFEEALGYLTARETFAVLNSPATLSALCAMPRHNG